MIIQVDCRSPRDNWWRASCVIPAREGQDTDCDYEYVGDGKTGPEAVQALLESIERGYVACELPVDTRPADFDIDPF